jgi:uncharacterized spore protein YtfJ
MDIQDLLTQARDGMTVKRVFGEPFERDGVTVIPVAKVMGGAGGGSGPAPAGDQGSGAGGGYGLMAKPAGIYVIKGDAVAWHPALDLNRVILGGQIVAIVLFLALRSIVKARTIGRRT